jgi:hypothetical protein
MEKYASFPMLMASAIITLVTGTPSGAVKKLATTIQQQQILPSLTCLLRDEVVAKHFHGQLLRLTGFRAKVNTSNEAIIKLALSTTTFTHLSNTTF